jgi:AmiR/NasT family two-component response regulator
VVAEAAKIDVDEAFTLLRGYARHHKLLLSEVARRVISRDLAVDAMRYPSSTSSGSPR